VLPFIWLLDCCIIILLNGYKVYISVMRNTEKYAVCGRYLSNTNWLV